MARPAYGYRYQLARRFLLGQRCHLCGAMGSDSADHVPALAEHRHVEGAACCRLEPAHLSCNTSAGGRMGNRRRRARARGLEGARVPRPSRAW